MKLVKAFLLGAALVSMTACAGGKGTAISEQQFKEEAAKVQEKTYSKAVVSYSSMSKDSADKEQNFTRSGKLNFTFKNGSFELDANQTVPDDLDLEGYVGGKVSTFINSVPSSYTAKYYKAPLGIYFEYKTGGSESGVSYTSSAYGYLQFNEYGFLVKGEVGEKSKTSVNVSGVKSSHSSESKSTLTISYQ